jgi:aminodeoxyfutalosine deaminase
MPHPRATTLHRGSVLLPLSSPPILDGGIAVRGGEILAVGPWRDLLRDHAGAAVSDHGEVILMPGLVNAHCHLDYTMMRGALPGCGSFSDWIQRLNGMRRSLERRDYLEAIASGFDELRHWGCTTVFNIESYPELLPALPQSHLRVWWFLEIMDVRSRLQSLEALEGAIGSVEKADEERGGYGISPHAPYTASGDLYRLAAQFARTHLLPLCTHLAESEEEMRMFAAGEGPLHAFLESIGRPMGDCGGRTPVQSVLGEGLLPEGSLLVHMNVLASPDREILRRTAGAYPVIHCPRTHAFFGRERFDLEFFMECGIPVLIGTDSLASNQDLNMFEEMRAMASSFPELSPGRILDMVTRLPAASIGRSGRIGELSPGAVADFLAIPDPGGTADFFERVLANRLPPRVWVSGHS